MKKLTDKECFNLAIRYNFDSQKITQTLNKDKIDMNYSDVIKIAEQYSHKNANAEEKERYSNSKQGENENTKKEKALARNIFIYQ